MIPLSEKYPEFFKEKLLLYRDRNFNNYNYHNLGVENFSIREGWYALLDKYLGKMYEHCQKINSYINIIEIKEKFGALDITFSNGNDVCNQLMIDAYQESRSICEWCSYPHTMTTTMKTDGWVYTICERCYSEEKHKRKFK